MATEAYRIEKLADATAKRDQLRLVYDAEPIWNKRKEWLAEELEFWSNKVAYLSNMRCGN